MAISKAARWISFAVPAQQQPSPTVASPKATQQFPVSSLADGKQFGLENFGNTCYANSVLQALYFCAPFRDLVIQSTDSSSPTNLSSSSQPALSPSPVASERLNGNGSATAAAPRPTSLGFSIPPTPPTLFSALRSLFVFISKNPLDRGTVSPRAFIDKLKEVNELFRSTMHQDAHEFLNYLLNKIVEEVGVDEHHKDKDGEGEDLSASIATLSSGPAMTVRTGSSQDDTTLVHRLFEGVLTSETRCLTCETVSSRDESFLDLSIDIEQNSSVTACLRQFSASEMLCQKNKFFCDSCCGLQEAEKRMKIKKLPNVLALHLKRFKYQEDVQKYIKLAYRVAFPLELRLFNTVDDAQDPDRLYELFAIVVHIGNGPHHGHYITIVKGPTSWLVFDDDKIGPIKESDIPKYFGDSPSGSAYVLYYQAVDLDPASLGIKPDSPLPTSAPIPVSVTDNANVFPVTVPSALTSDSLAQAQALDETGPAVPPGLGDESRSVAESETTWSSATAPSTPAFPATVSPKISVPALSVNTSSASHTAESHQHQHSHSYPHPQQPQQSPHPPNSPALSSNGRSHSGLLHGLRATSSTVGRSSVDKSPTQGRKSLGSRTEGASSSSKRPSTAPSAPDATTMNKADLPPVPKLEVNGKVKGKGKEPDKKPSLWFKRRSVKAETKEKDRPHHQQRDLESHSTASPTSSQGTSRSDPFGSLLDKDKGRGKDRDRDSKLKSGTVGRRPSTANAAPVRRVASTSVSSPPSHPPISIPAHATVSRAMGSAGISNSPPLSATVSAMSSSLGSTGSSKSQPHLPSTSTTAASNHRPVPPLPSGLLPIPIPTSSSLPSPTTTHLRPEHKKKSAPSLSTAIRRREHNDHDGSPLPSPASSSAPRTPRTPTTPTRPSTAGAPVRSSGSARPSVPLPISPIMSEPGNLTALRSAQKGEDTERGRTAAKSDAQDGNGKERDESRSHSRWRRPRSAQGMNVTVHGHTLGLPFMRRSNASLEKQNLEQQQGSGSRSRPASPAPAPGLASVPASPPMRPSTTPPNMSQSHSESTNDPNSTGVPSHHGHGYGSGYGYETESSRPGTGVSTKESSAVHFGSGLASPRADRPGGEGAHHAHSGSQTFKRAARKLSFSTSFMGLGKKDKERGEKGEKGEKEKKDRSRPPSSYASPPVSATSR